MADHYVLFDIPGGSDPIDKEFLEDMGHRVMVCGGPAEGQLCPILSGEGCELAEGADGIVFELDLERPQHRAILREYKGSLRGDVPIRVVVPRDQWAEHTQLLAGLKVLPHSPVAGDLDGLAAEMEANQGP